MEIHVLLIKIYEMENNIDVWNHQPDDVFPRIKQKRLVGGFNLPLWKIYEFVSWDDDIPKIYIEM